MARATWNGAVLAESEEAIRLEGNLYFPQESIHEKYFRESEKQTTCFWKGVASYFDIVVDGERNAAAAWTYPEPSEAASHIQDHVAFWRGVRTEE